MRQKNWGRFGALVAATLLVIASAAPVLAGDETPVKEEVQVIDKTCKDLPGFESGNMEGDASGEWGSITFTPDDGSLLLTVAEGWEVLLCIKKGSNASGQGPIVANGGDWYGEGDHMVDYPDSDPVDGFSHYHYQTREVLLPPPPPPPPPPLDCDDEGYATENPEECNPPPPLDCDDEGYATENPEECDEPETPEQPDPVIEVVERVECGLGVVYITTTTTEWVFDGESNEWVAGEPVVVQSMRPVTDEDDCDAPEGALTLACAADGGVTVTVDLNETTGQLLVYVGGFLVDTREFNGPQDGGTVHVDAAEGDIVEVRLFGGPNDDLLDEAQWTVDCEDTPPPVDPPDELPETGLDTVGLGLFGIGSLLGGITLLRRTRGLMT